MVSPVLQNSCKNNLQRQGAAGYNFSMQITTANSFRLVRDSDARCNFVRIMDLATNTEVDRTWTLAQARRVVAARGGRVVK